MSEGTALEWTQRRTIEEVNEEIDELCEEIRQEMGANL
jgi:hypothetical protein